MAIWRTPLTTLPLKSERILPWDNTAVGVIDEVAIYSRVLSPTEIAAIFNSGSYGKCIPNDAPAVVLQPTNQTTSVGSDLFLAGLASGSPALSYQWYFNATNSLAGATNRILLLTDVQPTQAGSYTLSAANGLGSANSATVTLTLTNAVCISAPSNLVAWWKAENNTVDQIGDDTGFALNNPFYTNGMVGTGFGLPSAYNNCFNFPNTARLLNTNAYTIEFWYKDTTGASGDAWTLLCQGQLGKSGSANNPLSSFQFNISGQDYYFNAAIIDPAYGYQGINYWPNPMQGMFHHLAGVFSQYSSNTVQILLYIDGQAMSLNNYVYGNLANCLNTAPVTVGAFGADGGVGPFGGVIDEVSIYSRALTAAEILSIYRAGPAGKCLTSNPPAIPAAGQPDEPNRCRRQ